MKRYKLKVTYGNVPKGSIMGFYENVTPDPTLFEEIKEESQEGGYHKDNDGLWVKDHPQQTVEKEENCKIHVGDCGCKYSKPQEKGRVLKASNIGIGGEDCVRCNMPVCGIDLDEHAKTCKPQEKEECKHDYENCVECAICPVCGTKHDPSKACPKSQPKQECKHEWEPGHYCCFCKRMIHKNEAFVWGEVVWSHELCPDKPQPRQKPRERIEEKRQQHVNEGCGDFNYAYILAIKDFLDEHSHLFTK